MLALGSHWPEPSSAAGEAICGQSLTSGLLASQGDSGLLGDWLSSRNLPTKDKERYVLPQSSQTNASLRRSGTLLLPAKMEWQGSDLLSCQRTDRTCETRVFKVLDTSQQRARKPERREQRRRLPQPCLGRVSRPQGREGSLVDLLSWGC